VAKEIEVKYLLKSPEQIEEILNHPMICAEISAPLRVINMDSVYYDTADGLLSKSRISLRRRRENDDTVFTIKTPVTTDGALSSRGEWQVKAKTLDCALPLLRKAGAPDELFKLLENNQLVPCARTTFVRKTAPLKFGAELCLDTGLLGIAPFAELELELNGGEVSALIEFGARCADVFGLTAESRSKFTRARQSFNANSK